MIPALPQRWESTLGKEVAEPYFDRLRSFVEAERNAHEVFPPVDQTFSALEFAAPEDVRVVILGQDPYHGPGQANGLAFSVQHGVPVPPSLRNIYKELYSDCDIEPAQHGELSDWARQGVLLLNTCLTVRAHDAGSHAGNGWERFTDTVIETVSERCPDAVFLLWGNPARAKRRLLAPTSAIIESAHPSPLAAYRGFFDSRPFSRCNAALRDAGHAPISWSLR
ncbi:MAG: uracil-DNA glycosylase [Acidobacteria bacterium]|nr:uracil-DNA glycosylase [Acidobacteriota bacterium]